MNRHLEQQNKRVWVISAGKYTDQGSCAINGEMISGPVSEYSISDLGLYLINPNAIKVTEKIIGYEVTHKDPDRNTLKNKILKLMPKGISKKSESEKIPAKRVIDPDYPSMSPFKDDTLESVFSKIEGHLLPYSPVIQQLNKEDENEIESILASCEHPAGHHYSLNLIGSISEKLRFLAYNIYKRVEIDLKSAYLSNGVFEMRGFDFKNYDPGNSHRLIRYMVDNNANYAILNPDNTLKFKIAVDFQVKFLQMLQQSLESDQKLLNAFHDCMKGDLRPYKLLFSKDLSATYSDTHLPEIFKNELDAGTIGKKQLLNITDTLNRSQRVVSFNTIKQDTEGKDHLFTTITVMHDLKELEFIKAYLPELYMKIEGNIPATELGKMYLLDSISGNHV